MDPIAVLQQTSLLRGLDEGALRAIAGRTVVKRLSRDAILFREGEPCRGLYVVTGGRVAAYQASPDGREQILDTVEPGNTIAELPLFDGYVFLYGPIEEAYETDRSGRIVQIIHVSDQSGLERELANIRLAMQCGAKLDPYPYLREGVRACVRSGPLRGLEGVIESRTACNRLILQVQILGRATAIELDGAALEPLE